MLAKASKTGKTARLEQQQDLGQPRPRPTEHLWAHLQTQSQHSRSTRRNVPGCQIQSHSRCELLPLLRRLAAAETKFMRCKPPPRARTASSHGAVDNHRGCNQLQALVALRLDGQRNSGKTRYPAPSCAGLGRRPAWRPCGGTPSAKTGTHATLKAGGNMRTRPAPARVTKRREC